MSNIYSDIPAALRPFTVPLGRNACRVKMQPGTHCVYLRGHLLGVVTEGVESVYFKANSGRGKMYASIDEVDAIVRSIAK